MKVWDQVREQVRSRSGVRNQVYWQIRDRVWYQVGEQVRELQVLRQVWRPVFKEINR
jgi:hypothetical protein